MCLSLPSIQGWLATFAQLEAFLPRKILLQGQGQPLSFVSQCCVQRTLGLYIIKVSPVVRACCPGKVMWGEEPQALPSGTLSSLLLHTPGQQGAPIGFRGWERTEEMSVQAAFSFHQPQYLNKSSGRNGFSLFNACTRFPSIVEGEPEAAWFTAVGRCGRGCSHHQGPGSREQMPPCRDHSRDALLLARPHPGVPGASQNSWTKHSKHESMVEFYIQTTETSLHVNPAGSLSFA